MIIDENFRQHELKDTLERQKTQFNNFRPQTSFRNSQLTISDTNEHANQERTRENEEKGRA